MKNYIGYTVTVLMAALTMVGCGKNSDSQPAAVANPNVYGSCVGCVGNTQLIATATASNQQLAEAIQLQFFGTSGATYQQYYNSSYSQVAAQGLLHIGGLAQECGLPAGDYQITTQSAPAVMNGSRIQGLQMVGTGPVQVVIQFDYIYFVSPTSIQVHGYMQGSAGAATRCEFYYQ